MVRPPFRHHGGLTRKARRAGRSPILRAAGTGRTGTGGPHAENLHPGPRGAPASPAGSGRAGGWSAGGPTPRRAQGGSPVDVALVLAVDVSRSIGEDGARLQREGYRAAVSDPRVVEAVRGGMVGALGLAYVEWAGIEYRRLVLPWTRIASQAASGVVLLTSGAGRGACSSRTW